MDSSDAYLLLISIIGHARVYFYCGNCGYTYGHGRAENATAVGVVLV
jgi:hypothetical protein